VWAQVVATLRYGILYLRRESGKLVPAEPFAVVDLIPATAMAMRHVPFAGTDSIDLIASKKTDAVATGKRLFGDDLPMAVPHFSQFADHWPSGCRPIRARGQI
jgi:hypothetical protein